MKKHILFLCFALMGIVAWAQTTVRGTVTSQSDGEPVIGASVLVKGTTNGTMTDIDGNFTLNNVPSNATITFSAVGYEKQAVAVNGRQTIDVVLKDVTSTLDELVVVGYGAVKKSDLTSSISTVKGEKITEVTTGNAMDALQGKVNGVQIASGGGPGTTPKVIIRGVTTVNGSDPLYVVDGMPVSGNINFLNNNDIESMEVLKDASAAAIYGTRGSNGVILITTKKGQAGKTHVSFSASAGFQTISKPSIAGANEYEQVYKTRYTNDGRVPVWNSPYENYSDADGTDWWDQVINSTALVQNYSLGISGGNDKWLYNLSFGYFRNNSQYDVGYWDKFNVRLNTEYNFNQYVKAGIELAPRVETWEDTPSLFSAAMAMDPTTPVYREESTGNYYSDFQRSYNNQEWNPAGSLSRSNSHSTKMGLIMNPYVQITPIKQLILRTQFSADAYFQRSSGFTPQFEIDPLEKNTYSSVYRNYSDNLNWNWTNTITYMETFAKKHNVTVMAGFTAERFANYWANASREDTPNASDLMQEVSAGTRNEAASGNTSYNTLASFLGRVNYNYDNRYYLTASVRTDGSSKFPAGNKYATFPAVSVAWRLSEESFMKDQHIFDNLKIRAGWGKVGNQAISNSAYLTLMGTSTYVFGQDPIRVVGSGVSSVGNNKLKWETVEDYNFGIDATALNNRLEFTFDVYRKKSHDMLYAKQNILAVGYPNWNSQVTMNIGSMQATGWELSVNWRDKVGSDFRYDLGLQLSSVKNKAIKFSGEGPITDTYTRNEDGTEISRFYGYVADGLFQNWEEVYSHTDEYGNLIQPNAQPGDIRFLDLDHDGSITENDKTYIGNAYPDLMIGLNMSFYYKNFDLTANFYGTVGNDIYNTTRSRYSGANGQNVLAGTLEKAWHGEGTSTDIPRLSVNDLNQNYSRVSSFFVEDGSYFRCKLLTLGYTLPSNLTRGTSLRFYLSAQNPFTITGYSGMDPERAMLDGGVLQTGVDYIAYPSPRTFLFGVDFKF